MTKEEAAEAAIAIVTANNGWSYNFSHSDYHELECVNHCTSYTNMPHTDPDAKHRPGCQVQAIIEATR